MSAELASSGMNQSCPSTPLRRSKRLQQKLALADCTDELCNLPQTNIFTTPKRKRNADIYKSPSPCETFSDQAKLERAISRHSQTPKTPRRVVQLLTPQSHHMRTPTCAFLARGFTPKRPDFTGTPATPGTPSVYTNARQQLRRSARVQQVVGRSEEKSKVFEFVSTCVESHTGAALYVSGAPGTGKTAVITEVVSQFSAENNDIQLCSLNCMTVSNPRTIFAKILAKLTNSLEAEALDQESAKQQLAAYLSRNEKQGSPCATVILVLDEMDYLVAREQEVLYTLFEWPTLENSRLCLIGIANALDLTERILPRLRTKNAVPKLLSFPPYSAKDIADIIQTRLNAVSGSPGVTFIHPAAIDLCSRKVASSSGDLRKALDICRRALELVECENREQVAKGEVSGVPKPATISHVVRATSVLSQSASSRIKSLSMQQKAILCTLVVHGKSSSNILDVFERYCALCQRDNLIHPLTSSEFCDVINSLEVLSIVQLRSKHRTSRLADRAVTLCVPEMDVITAVADIGTLKRFFDKS
ncbi:MCM loader [Schizosaccharomyces japonicus yFS275]|uniref:Cell division control protein n=1 Tax=Schizosaccharomyces japonicus (strain yFS275 / FY16936) TaxID=402676 RepID=B6JZN2_SCHJY|nr:MCM loader [Schizosaccharomyces japonicus yFS275]EEB07000.2 MCM loader [Schizosaccharomyces japonicus yFS275]